MGTPRARGRGGKRHTALLAVTVALAFALPAIVAAAQSWSISTAPTDVESGVSTDVDITITNTSGNNGGGESIGCVRITIPAEFTVDAAQVTSTTNGRIWSVSTSTSGSTLVEATAADDGERLLGDPDFDVLVLTVTVTGGPIGSHTWAADEFEKPDCTQNQNHPVSLPMDIGTGTNDPPLAGDDGYTMLHDRVLTVGAPGVLGDDSDPDLDALTAVLDTTTADGTLNLAADGSFDYTPDPGFVGTDSFTYHADDGTVGSGVATVTIDVTNTAPVAVDDAYSVDKNTVLSVGVGSGVLANDTDTDAGESSVATVVSGPADGTLVLASNGSFDYTPDPGFSGTDTFTYDVSDGAMTDTATVTVTVINNAPTAADDNYSGPKNLPLIVNAASGVLSNDGDPDGDGLSASVVATTSSGVLLLAANGGFTYTPAPGFDGTDQFTYQVTDGTDTATATATIAIANSAPASVDDSDTVIHDRTLTVPAPGVLGNDTDANGDALTAVTVTGPSFGSLTLDADGGYTYTPNAAFTGSDSFTYRADDGAATSGVATVTISVTNTSPATVDDSYASPKGGVTVGAGSGLLANDGDPDGDGLSTSVVAGPSNGSLSLAADGSFTYTPSGGFLGTDSFDYAASDGVATATATASITVSNAAPVSVDDAYIAFRNQPLSVAAPGVLGTDTDPDGDALSASVSVGPSHGGLTLASDGGFTYTPTSGYVGPDSFTYRASDGTDTSGDATVTLDVRNRKPVATGEKASVDAGASITDPAPGLLFNDIDPDGDVLSSTLATGPAHGTATIAANGAWTYVPRAGFSGSDSFTYTVSDGLLSSTPATVQITVRPPIPPSTPAPTPAPSAGPVASPAPTSSPSPAPSPTPSPSPSPSPSTTPVASASVTPRPDRSPSPAGSGSGGGGAGQEAFSIPDAVAEGGGTDDISLAAAALGGLGSILWAVPSLILSVPGLLLVLAIAAQALGGLAWLPLARRKLGTFGLRNGRQAGASTRS